MFEKKRKVQTWPAVDRPAFSKEGAAMPKPTDKNDRLGRLAEIAARPRSREALQAEYG
jgi:hypothetical protein